MHVLQFSGGLDSLACLLLLKDLPGLNVLMIQTDGQYPSVLEYTHMLMQRFPQLPFHICRTERNLAQHGYPVDVVPLRWTALGQLVRGAGDVRYQDFMACCSRAIWEPMARATEALGATTIYRGQRNDDRLRAPLADGQEVNGVTYRFPIATWTRPMVLKFVDEQASDLWPPGYGEGELTSRDCMDCTAYLQDNEQRIRNLPGPVFRRVDAVLKRWREDVLAELRS